MTNPFDQQEAIAGVKKIIAVGSGKGGVGKSTLSANIALALKNKGLKVGLIDADLYGPSQARLFGALHQKAEIGENEKINPVRRYGIDLMSMAFFIDEKEAVVWRGPMLFKAMDQFFRDVNWGEKDVIVIDLPPGTGDIALTMAQKIPISQAIVVSTPQGLSIADAKKAWDMFLKIGIPVSCFVENMSEIQLEGMKEPVSLFPQGGVEELVKTLEVPYHFKMPFSPELALGAEAGVPMMSSLNPTGKLAERFNEIADVIQSLK